MASPIKQSSLLLSRLIRPSSLLRPISSSIRYAATTTTNTSTSTSQPSTSLPTKPSKSSTSIDFTSRYTSPPFSSLPKTLQAWLLDFHTHSPLSILSIPSSIYSTPTRIDLFHRCVTWQRNLLRQGTHSTKNRSNVRGTTRKGAPQKGRGKARIGSLRAAQFRGGGVVFGPKPRSHATSLPVLVRELALRSALATKFRQNQIVFTNPIKLESHKTKDLLPVLNYYKPMSLSGLSEAERSGGSEREYSSILIISGIGEPKMKGKKSQNVQRGEGMEGILADEKLLKAANNLPDVKVIGARHINVYDLLKHEYCIVDEHARKWLEERLVPL